MLHGVEIKSAVQELRHEGFAFLYRGILPPLAQRTVSLSLMFGLYDGTKRPLVKYGANEYLAKTIAGMAAGKSSNYCVLSREKKIFTQQLMNFEVEIDQMEIVGLWLELC